MLKTGIPIGDSIIKVKNEPFFRIVKVSELEVGKAHLWHYPSCINPKTYHLIEYNLRNEPLQINQQNVQNGKIKKLALYNSHRHFFGIANSLCL